MKNIRVLPTRWRRKPAGIEITSLLPYVLIGCSRTRSVSARLVLNTCIPVRPFTVEFANWSSVQLSLCAVNRPLRSKQEKVCKWRTSFVRQPTGQWSIADSSPATPCRRTRLILAPAVVQDKTLSIRHSRGVSSCTTLQCAASVATRRHWVWRLPTNTEIHNVA